MLGGSGGPWGGSGGGTLYPGSPAGGYVQGGNGAAPGGGGGGGGTGDLPTPGTQTRPVGPNGSASGTGGAGHVIISYPSEQANISNIPPSLSWTSGVANGRKYYCFSGGAGTITV